ncbi:hypothetical protein K461DRAFT_324684 [Myriangium duriaei CBS 260.36]|uniref:RNA-dependent RNA polymerase n=1 Tax=Myriangium duriaei CBS 260.36 TaxID=1168546 RepID=A0A9P4IUY1_9PEZI|nr:hypothetical protein K461DRAFT_324684 [Myriangium duriaei CBS 260.36]
MVGSDIPRPGHATPKHKKAHAEIDSVLETLRLAGLPIFLLKEPSSPSSRPNSLTSNVRDLISYLFFQNKDALENIVQGFIAEKQSTARQHTDTEKSSTARLANLCEKLKDAKYSTLAKTRLRNSDIRNLFASAKPNVYSHTLDIDKDVPRIVKASRAPQKQDSCNDTPRAPAKQTFQREDSTRSVRSTSTTSSSAEEAVFGITTAATSFYDEGNGSCEAETPASSFATEPGAAASQETNYGSQICLDDFTKFDRLDATDVRCAKLDMDYSKAARRSTTTATLGAQEPVSQIKHVKQFLPPITSHQQLIAELKKSQITTTASEKDYTKLDASSASFRLKYLPEERMVDFDFPEQLDSLNFATRFLAYRARMKDAANKTVLDSILNANESVTAIQKKLQLWIENILTPAEVFCQEKNSYSGKLVVRKSKDALLEFTPSPPSVESHSRLERAFDPQRFLTVVFAYPNAKDLQDLSLRNAEPLFKQYFREFLLRPQDILGTTFRVYYVESLGHEDNANRYRLRFFATDGPNLTTIGVETLIDWTLCVRYNLNVDIAKLWARVELSLSRTESTVTFLPFQVRQCPRGSTVLADGTPEATEFNDPALALDFSKQPMEERAIMNDGCSRLSVAAAKQICERLNLSRPWPVAFQGRLNGAKGIWTIAAPYDTQDGIWIDVNESQLKVKPREADLDDRTCEPGRWTFELVAYSTMPSASYLYLDFLPILEDRGVKREIIIGIIAQQLNMDFDGLMQSLKSSSDLRTWMATSFASKETRDRENGIAWVAGLPKEDHEKAVLLLDNGFSALSNRTLAAYMSKQVGRWAQDMLERLRIRSDKAVMPFGIADPRECLQPGEVCLNFSELTGDGKASLQGEVLVARLPALRRSDIQKVRAVFRPDLSDLKDVVIFPCKGQIPLAAKLQGGDYDGDKFWVCWDDRLVAPFKNAPIPPNIYSMEHYGIEKNTETVGELLGLTKDTAMEQPLRLDLMVKRAVESAFEDDMLGRVTNAHRRLAYKLNKLDHSDVEHLANVHDLIIDSKKNGLRWTEANFRELMERMNQPIKLPMAIYERALKDGLKTFGDPDHPLEGTDFILDEIALNHALPIVQECVWKVERELQLKSKLLPEPPNEGLDDTLLAAYHSLTRKAEQNVTAKRNLDHLKRSTQELIAHWNSYFVALPDGEKSWNKVYSKAINDCYCRYNAILPVSVVTQAFAGDKYARNDSRSEHEKCMIDEWMEKVTPHDFSKWELYRASVLYERRMSRPPDRHGVKSKFPFLMAGGELCHLKRTSTPGSRGMSKEIHAINRPRKRIKVFYHGLWTNSRQDGRSDEEGDIEQ